MKTTTTSTTLRLTTNLKGGVFVPNHSALKVRSGVKSGGVFVPNHSALKVRSGVKSGAEGQAWNHSALKVRPRGKAGGARCDI